MIRLVVLCGWGGVGSASRFLFEELGEHLLPRHRHLVTAVINVLGCFLVAFTLRSGMNLIGNGLLAHPSAYTFDTYLASGFCGGFTTFSAAIAIPQQIWVQGRRLAAFLTTVTTPLLAVGAFCLGLVMSGH